MKTFLKATAGISLIVMAIMGIKILWDKHQENQF